MSSESSTDSKSSAGAAAAPPPVAPRAKKRTAKVRPSSSMEANVPENAEKPKLETILHRRSTGSTLVPDDSNEGGKSVPSRSGLLVRSFLCDSVQLFFLDVQVNTCYDDDDIGLVYYTFPMRKGTLSVGPYNMLPY